jgi:hypothetical protein
MVRALHLKHAASFRIAKKHEKDATVIGVDIWEGAHGSDSSKPYDSYLPKVSKFVKGMGDKMAYNVIMDNNELFMGNNWMKAAGQGGIPCSFIIKRWNDSVDRSSNRSGLNCCGSKQRQL